MTTTKVMFICLGNICRSPMAEFVLRHQVKQLGVSKRFEISSSGTAGFHNGENAHHGTLHKMKQYGISTEGFVSSPTLPEYGTEYDYLLVMDDSNYTNTLKIVGPDHTAKLIKLVQFTKSGYHEVPDPWYTGDFDETFELVWEGCKGFLEKELGYDTRKLKVPAKKF